jgi:CO/xanthine dehydrogenase Mo-binding subunit
MTTEYQHNVVLSTTNYNVIGTRPIRPDGADKVTGRALYGADFNTSGLLHGKVLRSPHAHAIIKSIDTSEAEAMPGVLAVVTHKDFPQTADAIVDMGEEVTTLDWLRDNLLASKKALYKGHAIAAVAAANPHAAEEAVAKIKVEYEVLKPVLTAPEGMKASAPILHPGLKTEELGTKTDKVSNVASHFQHVKGDIAKGFANADVVLEREYNTKTVHQGYIEPHNATAFWSSDGRLHVWCSTQGSFVVRDSLAQVLAMPVGQIRVTPMEIGGGFGGKIPIYVEPIAALLSKKSGHAVKVVMSRADVFESTGPTSGCNMRIKIGAKNDGSITAMQAYLAFEAGAFPGSPVGAAAMCVFAAYDVENMTIDGYDVVVNKPKAAPYRAPGAPNAAFATEQAVDDMARELGMDPLDFRLKNAAKEGTRQAHGVVFPRVGCIEVLEAMKNHPHYNTPLSGPNQGRGVAIGYWFNIGFESAVNIAVNTDGTITLIEGSTDIGGTRSSISMQAAEVLGIRAEDVKPSVVDTDSIGFTAVTGGSRTTFATGMVAYEAARDVERQMIERAATIWEIPVEEVEHQNGVYQSKSDPELRMTFKEIAEKMHTTGGSIVGRASFHTGGAGVGGGSFCGNIVDLEIDPETGKTQVLRFTCVQDAGKAIHPSYVEGQMQGGSVQGIGWALNEEYYMGDGGNMINSTLLDYRMPTALDLPMIDTVIVEVPNPEHPYGVRGVGEANIVPPQAAVANAVRDAIGIRMPNLPINPVSIVEALWNKDK